jgi:hypothetical protein
VYVAKQFLPSLSSADVVIFADLGCYTDSVSARSLVNGIQRPATDSKWTADSVRSYFPFPQRLTLTYLPLPLAVPLCCFRCWLLLCRYHLRRFVLFLPLSSLSFPPSFFVSATFPPRILPPLTDLTRTITNPQASAGAPTTSL